MRRPTPQIFAASNGLTYDFGRSVPWGGRGGPIVPRSYRHLFPNRAAPRILRELLRNRHLTWADLGRRFWIGHRLDSLPKSVWNEIASRMVQAPIPYKEVAIPAGLPLGKVANMAVRIRTGNGIRRLARELGEETLDRSVLVEDLLEVTNVGISTVLDLLCVMESAELDSSDLQIKGESDGDSQPGFVSAPLRQMRDLAVWALSETNSVTLGDAIRYLMQRPASVEEWRRVGSIELRALAEPPPHPYHTIEQWVSNLPELQKYIFERRIVSNEGKPAPLAELAEQFGYTRERIRQLLKLLLDQFRDFMRSSEGRSVGWRVDSMRIRFGVAVPEDYAQEFLDPPEGGTDYSRVLLEFGGPYVMKKGWWMLKGAIGADPTKSILDKNVDRYGRVSLEQAERILGAWGLRKAFHHQWLTREGRCRWFEDYLVRWNVPTADKLHFALASLSEPSTAEELLAFAGERRSVQGARNIMSVDNRFTRTSQRQWGLSEWGLPEYRGIALSIRKMLEDAGGSLPIAEVLEKMHGVFGTPKGSVSAFCRAPLFVIEGESVRVRRQDEEYVFPDVPRAGVPGMFSLGDDRIGILLKVDRDVLRGSGQAIGAGSPTVLRMIPGSGRTFRGQDGLSLKISFSETGITGPTLGSMRKIAESLGATRGDWLTLVLDLRQGHLEARATRVGDHQPTWGLVGRLTGLADHVDLTGLGKALGCDPAKVKEVLASRGDRVVIDAMPHEENIHHPEGSAQWRYGP